MWKIDIGNQSVSFLVCAGFGFGFCFLYDILRGARRAKSFSAFGVAFQDLLYFIFITLITFFLLLKYTCGELRFYIFAALLIGFLLCRVTLSRFFLPIFKFVFSVIFRAFGAVKAFFAACSGKSARFLHKTALKIKKYCKKFLQHKR